MKRSIIIIIALFIVLGLIAYLIIPSSNERITSYEITPIDLSLDYGAITKIDIKKPGKFITMENLNGKWMITSPGYFVANESYIQQLINSLRNLKLGSLISSNPEKQNLYQVDTTGAILSISDRTGKTVSLIVGKTDPSFAGVYIRSVNSNDVYLSEGINTWTINQDIKEWREKVIFSSETDSIRQLTYKIRSKTYDFKRDSTSWKYGNDTVSTTSMTPALHNLTNLRVDDFVDTVYVPKTDPVTLTVTTSVDFTFNFYPIPPDSSKYYVETAFTEQKFLLNKWTINELLKPLEGKK